MGIKATEILKTKDIYVTINLSFSERKDFMKITVYAGNNPDVLSKMESENAQKKCDTKENDTGAIYAGNLNLNSIFDTTTDEKRKQAQQKAWNVVSEAWAADNAVDDMIQERRDYYNEAKKVRDEAASQIYHLNEEAACLQEQYNIEDDSQEQKDLELLKKASDIWSGFSDETLTEDEVMRLRDMDTSQLTEYQKRALELNSRAGVYKDELQKANLKMEGALSDIRSIQLERLKSHAMADADKQAEQILEAAGKEIIADITNDAQENIEEKQEEADKKAEKEAEKKEDREQELKEIKEKRAIEEAVMEGTKEAVERAKAEIRKNEAPKIDITNMIDITETNIQGKDVKSSLDEIKNSMKLLDADLSGIKVDEMV